MLSFKELNKEYEAKQKEEKEKIRRQPSKYKRFWMWVWYWFIFPFKWIWVNIRDWKTALIFGLVFLVVSSEVWVPYLLGFIFNNNWLIGIGSTCWAFWLAPGTPFMVICIGLTMAVKALLNRIITWRVSKCQKKLKNKNEQEQ